MKRKDSASERAAQLMLVASVIDGLRRETSPFVDAATRQHYMLLSEGLRRCAFTSPSQRRG